VGIVGIVGIEGIINHKHPYTTKMGYSNWECPQQTPNVACRKASSRDMGASFSTNQLCLGQAQETTIIHPESRQ